jgi:hypothetical protein
LQHLVEIGVFVAQGSGRNVHYQLDKNEQKCSKK